MSTKDDIVSSLPSCPTSIPHDFWVALHVAPFSKSYFSRHVAPSAHSESDREFWLGIQDERGRSISAFPWRVNHRCPETLDDLLMLTLVHQPTAMEVVSAATARLINSVRPHPLSQLLPAPDEEWVGKPLLLLNEPDELQSQLNLLLLQDELQRISGVSHHLSAALVPHGVHHNFSMMHSVREFQDKDEIYSPSTQAHVLMCYIASTQHKLCELSCLYPNTRSQ